MPLTPEQRFGIAAALAMPSQMRATIEGRLDAAGNYTPDQSRPAGSPEAAYGRLTQYLLDSHGVPPADLKADKDNILAIFDPTGLIAQDGPAICAALSSYYAPGKPCPDPPVEDQLMNVTLPA